MIAMQQAVRKPLKGANIVCDGNSHMAGLGGSLTMAARLAARPELAGLGLTCTSFAVSGQTLTDMSSDAVQQIDTQLVRGVTNILLVWEIRNELLKNGDVSAAFQKLLDYCRPRRAAGWDRLHVLTCLGATQTPSWGTAADYSAKLGQVNALLKANPSAFCDRLIPLDDPRLQTVSPSYFGSDNIHLLDAGYDLAADSVVQVLLRS